MKDTAEICPSRTPWSTEPGHKPPGKSSVSGQTLRRLTHQNQGQPQWTESVLTACWPQGPSKLGFIASQAVSAKRVAVNRTFFTQQCSGVSSPPQKLQPGLGGGRQGVWGVSVREQHPQHDSLQQPRGKWHLFCLCHLCVQKHLLLRLTANSSWKERALFLTLACSMLTCYGWSQSQSELACSSNSSPAWAPTAFRLRCHSKDFTSQTTLERNKKVSVITRPKAVKNCPYLTGRIRKGVRKFSAPETALGRALKTITFANERKNKDNFADENLKQAHRWPPRSALNIPHRYLSTFHDPSHPETHPHSNVSLSQPLKVFPKA